MILAVQPVHVPPNQRKGCILVATKPSSALEIRVYMTGREIMVFRSGSGLVAQGFSFSLGSPAVSGT